MAQVFPILKEARREVLEDLMDYAHAQLIINKVVDGTMKVEEMPTQFPSPFAFGLILSGYSDVIKVEDKQEFLKRMHQQVLARIALKQGKRLLRKKQEEFSYWKFWEEAQRKQENEKDSYKEKLKMQVWRLKHVPIYAKEELVKLIEFGSMRKEVWGEMKMYKQDIEENWPTELREFVMGKMEGVV